MKVVVFILCISMTRLALSQNKAVDEIYFEISCGFAAQTSKDIKAFQAIVERNDTFLLRNKLFNGSKLEQVLAAITLRHLQTNRSIKLNSHEQNQIQEISKLKDKFSLCFTCTFQQEGTVKDLFTRKQYSTSYSIIVSFLSNKQ